MLQLFYKQLIQVWHCDGAVTVPLPLSFSLPTQYPSLRKRQAYEVILLIQLTDFHFDDNTVFSSTL
jgi:hypothetical protein